MEAEERVRRRIRTGRSSHSWLFFISRDGCVRSNLGMGNPGMALWRWKPNVTNQMLTSTQRERKSSDTVVSAALSCALLQQSFTLKASVASHCHLNLFAVFFSTTTKEILDYFRSTAKVTRDTGGTLSISMFESIQENCSHCYDCMAKQTRSDTVSSSQP